MAKVLERMVRLVQHFGLKNISAERYYYKTKDPQALGMLPKRGCTPKPAGFVVILKSYNCYFLVLIVTVV